MDQKHTTLGRLLAGVLAAGMTFAPFATLAQRAGRGANNPVRNIAISGATADGQTFTGTLDIERFEAVGDQLLAVGQVNGRFSGGKPVNHQAVAIPVTCIVAGDPAGICPPPTTGALERKGGAVAPATWDPSRGPTIIQAQARGSCDILTLVLGPLHLDLLGLVVDLNQVVLTLTGETGSGNLLGNLLCAVAGLLDGTGGVTGALTQVAGLLSEAVNILNGILAGL
ncbi:MAG TPA: hypothetical protein VFL83_14435 [Anaeromyxobacter sp.]|nr:hypothetical protein [Anaeromyxobacter sp.]